MKMEITRIQYNFHNSHWAKAWNIWFLNANIIFVETGELKFDLLEMSLKMQSVTSVFWKEISKQTVNLVLI